MISGLLARKTIGKTRLNMLRYFSVLTLTIGVSATANATFIDSNTYLTDTSTGLDWLDMSYTDGLSYDAVHASTTSGPLSDWTIATGAQVVTLVTNFIGNTPVSDYPGNPTAATDPNGAFHSANNSVKDLVSLIGATYAGNDHGFTLGYTSDAAGIDINGTGIDHLTVQFGWWDVFADEFYGYDRWGYDNTVANDFLGTFLVRNSTVPEPTIIVLMGLGLTGLTIFNRKRKV